MSIEFCNICEHKVIPDNEGNCPQCSLKLISNTKEEQISKDVSNHNPNKIMKNDKIL